jgi:hypothetical protein
MKMGFEGEIYYGAAGATAATLLTNIRDENYDFDHGSGDTTVRGTGAAPPIETGRATSRKVTLGWNMTNDPTDTSLAALLAAAYGSTPVAIRTKDRAAGKGFDGDVYLKVKHGKPLKGEQTYDFTVDTVTRENRAPQLYV